MHTCTHTEYKYTHTGMIKHDLIHVVQYKYIHDLKNPPRKYIIPIRHKTKTPATETPPAQTEKLKIHQNNPENKAQKKVETADT